MKKITIKDVAKAANVSEATVSRVMSNSQLISTKTKTRVMEIIKELDYFPNSAAVSLTKSSSNIIGVVINGNQNALQNDFFTETLAYINKFALDKGYYILYLQLNNNEEVYDGIYKLIRTNRIDGLIFMNFVEGEKDIEYLQSIDFPYVVIGTPENKKSRLWVDNDNVKSCYDITEICIKKGKKELAFLSGPKNLTVSKHRKQGYLDALNKYNIKVNKEYILNTKFTTTESYQIVKNFLSKNVVDVIITTDDVLAIGAMRAIKDLDLKVEVTGFNNTKLRTYLNYDFLTVDIQYRDLAMGTVELLTNKIENKENAKNYIVVQTEIIK
ncbi:LacI family DNA-binding transcriptional regulator [Pseudostreptobacillus hongkongensis]|uniref:LacI family DNA-binding transcriptional regulator n=1 Tax=Pseudostreptobacillus hongkongensis TaxID=1162717 RepID=UPI000829E4AA|nr:LacI family DNA-binding transcriptional regulator [Pseudostreptobacillus hongkongensis]